MRATGKRSSRKKRELLVAFAWWSIGFVVVFVILTIQLIINQPRPHAQPAIAGVQPKQQPSSSSVPSARTASAEDLYSVNVPSSPASFREAASIASEDDDRVQPLLGLSTDELGEPRRASLPGFESSEPAEPEFPQRSEDQLYEGRGYVPSGFHLNNFEETKVIPLSRRESRRDFFGVNLDRSPDEATGFNQLKELPGVRTANFGTELKLR